MKETLIITGTIDYADEFDYPIRSVISPEQRTALIEALKVTNIGNPEIYFGTNEYVSIGEKEFINMLNKAVPITDAELSTLKKFGGTFGIDVVANITDYIYEELEEDESLTAEFNNFKQVFK